MFVLFAFAAQREKRQEKEGREKATSKFIPLSKTSTSTTRSFDKEAAVRGGITKSYIGQTRRQTTMGRIEELPDDFDESLDLNKAPVFTPPPAAKEPSFLPSGETPFGIKKDALPKGSEALPAMPPAMESVKSHTADEIIELMNQTPLFMTDVDKALQAGR